MADERTVVAERGLLSVPDAVWDLAVRQAQVIGLLAQADVVGLGAVDAAAAQLGISRRKVYLLLRRWRRGEGVVSDLLPGRSDGGRRGGRLPDEVEVLIRDVLRRQYLTRQKKTVAAVHREIVRVARTRGLQAPSRGTVERRIAMVDPVEEARRREGPDSARALEAAGGQPPPVTAVLQQVQMDHTVVDLEVVDEQHRLPIGRPYITAGIDVFTRSIPGLGVTLEAPSATSVGLCLAHMVTDKRAWLERLGVEVDWPMSGKPAEASQSPSWSTSTSGSDAASSWPRWPNSSRPCATSPPGWSSPRARSKVATPRPRPSCGCCVSTTRPLRSRQPTDRGRPGGVHRGDRAVGGRAAGQMLPGPAGRRARASPSGPPMRKIIPVCGW
jgi:hypothetical protein